MTPANINQQGQTSPRSIGPGDRLKSARIEQGLSIEDVATRMHLSVGILQAIEENNFDDITAPIFVKGYLRAYARIVSLDEDDMIEQYQNYYSEEDPPISSTSNLAPEISSDDARIKWTTYLVIIGLLGSLAVWWWNQYEINTEVVSLDAERTGSIQQPETAQPEATSDFAVNEIEITVDNNSTDTGEIEVSSMPLVEPEVIGLTVAEDTQETASLQQVESEPELESAPEPTIEAVVEQELEDVIAEFPPEEISRISPVGSEQLKIIIHADTWIDIKDASGHPLARELSRANQTLNLTGKAPFAVFLGNGHGVELIYNNETIDITDRIRDNNTARIKVGSS